MSERTQVVDGQRGEVSGEIGEGLAQLIDALGTHVLDIVAGDPSISGNVNTWTIYDPQDDAAFPARSVVLGVGLVDAGTILEVVEAMAHDDAAALVVRSGIHLDDRSRDRIRATSVVVLSLADGSSWQQLSTSLRRELNGLARGLGAPPAVFGGLPINDLFSLANAICALIDAPVTIEDCSSRVLAFSDRQDETDPARIATVLGRQTPDVYTRGDEERGVMRLLRRSERPLFIEPGIVEDARTALPRAAIAIRAGDELLGFIWAVVREPLSLEREELLVAASRFAALQLLELRSGAETGRRGTSTLVLSVIEGRDDAADAIARLGLANVPCVVVAIGEAAGSSAYAPSGAFGANAADLARRNAERRRIANAFAVHLAASKRGSVVAEVGEQIYALVPAQLGKKSVDAILRACRAFLDSVGRGLGGLIGIGSIATRVEEVPGSRSAADRALRVLRTYGGDERVARTEDVDDQAWLLDLTDLIVGSGRQPSGAFERLVRYDESKDGASMVATLAAWLQAHGDVQAAAGMLHVHENTLRYRLRRISEIGQVDLADPDCRLILALQIKVFGTP